MKIHYPSLFIGAAFLLTQFSCSIYIPIMPDLVTIFHTKPELVKLSISLFFLGYALGQLFWGTASDRYGRKSMICLSLGLYVGFSLLTTLAHTIGLFLLAYCILGFMAAAYTSIGNALLKDIFKEKTAQAIANIGVVMAAGPMIAPFIGAKLYLYFNWQTLFYSLAILAFIVLIGLNITLTSPSKKEQKKTASNESLWQIYRQILSCRQYASYLFCLGLAFGCLFGFLDVNSFIYINYFHLTIEQFARLNIILLGCYFIASLVNRSLIKRFTPKASVTIGLAFSVIGALILLLLMSNLGLISFSIAMGILIFGVGIIVPATKAGAMMSIHQHTGSASSLMKFTQSSINIICVSIFAKLSLKISLMPLAISYGIIIFAALLIAIIGLQLFQYSEFKLI